MNRIIQQSETDLKKFAAVIDLDKQLFYKYSIVKVMKDDRFMIFDPVIAFTMKGIVTDGDKLEYCILDLNEMTLSFDDGNIFKLSITVSISHKGKAEVNDG